jgi:hypothetical protein
MEDLHGPQTQVAEGACAIKVSMTCSYLINSYLYLPIKRTDHALFVSWHVSLFSVIESPPRPSLPSQNVFGPFGDA